MKVVASNRSAFHDYSITEKLEAGISLVPEEIKAVRVGKVSLAGSFARVLKGEFWLLNMHIHTEDAERTRKLLVHKTELDHIAGKLAQGFTVIPLRIYLKRSYAKVELGLGKRRRKADKREVLKRRAQNREIEQELRAKNL